MVGQIPTFAVDIPTYIHANPTTEYLLTITSKDLHTKLREFASCIAGLSDVCIDGHAYCIWAANRTGLKDVPAIGVKLRREIKADYRAAADELGITPSACQAITWVAWRRIHEVTK